MFNLLKSSVNERYSVGLNKHVNLKIVNSVIPNRGTVFGKLVCNEIYTSKIDVYLPFLLENRMK